MAGSSTSFWALTSGALGAAASYFAKLAFATNDWTETTVSLSSCPSVQEWSTSFQSFNGALTWISCHGLTILLPRLACLIAMIVCNAAMVACFVGGLQDAGSIAGTALATAANFVTSGVAGYFVWNEALPSATGFGMVVVGAFLLVWAQMPEQDETEKPSRTNQAPQNAKKEN